MTKTNRSWDIISKEQRHLAIEEIIDFFKTERNEEIGIIASEDILDMFLQTTGKWIYNRGVDDTKELIKNRLDEAILEIDFSVKRE